MSKQLGLMRHHARKATGTSQLLQIWILLKSFISQRAKMQQQLADLNLISLGILEFQPIYPNFVVTCLQPLFVELKTISPIPISHMTNFIS